MKLNQKQADLLAKQVYSTLLERNEFKIDAAKEREIKNWYNKKSALLKQRDEINKSISQLDYSLPKITGKLNKSVYSSDDFETIIQKMADSAVPSLQAISDEIVLKAMFANEGDMQNFVDSIVDKFSKKKPQKVKA